MASQDRGVPKVGFPCEIENVSDDWNGAQDGVQRQIASHPEQCRARHAQSKGLYQNPPSKNGANGIARAGD
jgi:hypothetical protein